MIEFLQHKEATIAREILAVQIPAYIKETEIIGFDGIPALQEKVKDIQASHERFAGYRKNGKLIGVISYEKNMHYLTIAGLLCILTVSEKELDERFCNLSLIIMKTLRKSK